MDILLLKKPKKVTLKEMMELERVEDQNIKTDKINPTLGVIDEQAVATAEPIEPNYIPLRDNAIVQSVGKSGWQISDIWRDIRVDGFCG